MRSRTRRTLVVVVHKHNLNTPLPGLTQRPTIHHIFSFSKCALKSRTKVSLFWSMLTWIVPVNKHNRRRGEYNVKCVKPTLIQNYYNVNCFVSLYNKKQFKKWCGIIWYVTPLSPSHIFQQELMMLIRRKLCSGR